jgi:hypothetical protein
LKKIGYNFGVVAFQIPLVYIALAPYLNDGTTLLRNAILILFPLFIWLFNPIKIDRNLLISSFVMLLPIWYLISWVIYRQQSFSDFLLGGYGRGTGFLSLVGVLLTFLLISQKIETNFDKLFKYTYYTLFLALIHGVLQFFSLDPISWANNTTGLYLTTGNTNFASTFLGILSIFLIMHFFVAGTRLRIILGILILINVLLILNTKSSQGFLIFIFNLTFATLVMSRVGLKLFSKKKPGNRTVLFVTLILSIIYVISQFWNLRELVLNLRTDLQIDSRLSYWRIGYEIGKDNIMFGVGKDQLFYFSPEYLNELYSKRIMELTSIDKSHNVILDHFANGGLIAALVWILFCVLIFKCILNLLSENNLKITKWKLFPFISIWITYFFQSMISPDDLLLTLLGITSAGVIYGLNGVNNKKRVQNI